MTAALISSPSLVCRCRPRNVLPASVEVVEQGDLWFRFASEASSEINHHVLKALLDAGAKVIGLNEVPRSLEEVYLKVIELEGGEI